MSLRWCIAVSVLIHFLALGVPWDIFMEKSIAASVPIQVTLTDKAPDKKSEEKSLKDVSANENDEPVMQPVAMKEIEPPEQKLPEESSDGVSFVTNKKVSLDYMKRLKSKIFFAWDYPLAASENGFSGTVKLFFILNEKGKLEDIRVIKTSGYKELDTAAVAAVRNASPFGPLEKDYSGSSLEITGSFKYVIN